MQIELKHNRSKLAKCALIFLALFLDSCGINTQQSHLSDNSNKNTAEIYLAVSKSDNDALNVSVAAPSSLSQLRICESSSACPQEDTNASKSLTVDVDGSQTKIYKVNLLLKLNSQNVWTISGVKSGESNEPVNQTFSISQSDPQTPNNTNQGLNWKVVLMASDQGNSQAWIPAFDNARKKLKEFFSGRNISAGNIRELSLKPTFITQDILQTSAGNFKLQLQSLDAKGSNDACLIHMTSHGSQTGFNLGNQMFAPSDLNDALTAGCGDRPTVVMISACYSGLYVLDSSGVKKPNRIILTAARNDRTSFGCGVENQYVYWDSCLIEGLTSGKSQTWASLASGITQCISVKENGLTPSLPQTFIGSDVADLPVP